ncbi:hypothetical protein HPB51_001304 [Rhipicephalus microplus]|uniref:FF domain-containing protein n=1 Tax=Rhipicephalus microplus TaxID=6941 RepID=A0A9J6D8C8_RHIMP|nr:hypothetical protein HPB51_001304 [Rhipicephalus microplus]
MSSLKRPLCTADARAQYLSGDSARGATVNIRYQVSAFSTWEKELHKIVFDSRYLLLTSKERKQVFEKYVKERAEEERREKRNKMRERKDQFQQLLETAGLNSKSTFSDFAQKYGKDERFKNIEKMRERESMFNDFVQELRKLEREERLSQREKENIHGRGFVVPHLMQLLIALHFHGVGMFQLGSDGLVNVS